MKKLEFKIFQSRIQSRTARLVADSSTAGNLEGDDEMHAPAQFLAHVYRMPFPTPFFGTPVPLPSLNEYRRIFVIWGCKPLDFEEDKTKTMTMNRTI
jgi:hypothetical protein